MAWRATSVAARLDAVEATARPLPTTSALQRWQADAAALRFHLLEAAKTAPVVALIGGTGTGKSTLLNRLLEQNLSATSFRRTFTGGPVIVVGSGHPLPGNYLAVPHLAPAAVPTAGVTDQLVVVSAESPLLSDLSLMDTPDLDGNQPAHIAQADRAFRWASAIVFLVTPEKYQMTELLPYYRLARRYGLASLFVMNKVEEAAVVEDYEQLLQREGAERGEPPVFALPRDDSGYQSPSGRDLASLRGAIGQLAGRKASESGLANRVADLAGRFQDQIIGPARQQRREVDAMIGALRAMETPAPGIDVNPITEQLQRRLQQRSVLYLIGPQRVMDRVRQVPSLLARLPRTAWDMARGKGAGSADEAAAARQVPDFRVALIDQFTVVQSRIDDVLRSSRAGEALLKADQAGYASSKVNVEDAGKIADAELADLKDWLERRWNGTPRDTAILLKLLRYLPGGAKIAQWSEAAPYLLAVIVATHHAFFGHIDLLVLGGYSMVTWLTERVSNEVASRTRLTNRRIEQRFADLAHQQIQRVCSWLETQAPPSQSLQAMERAVSALGEMIE